MRSSKAKTYSVISGEPQLGRTREWTDTYDKDDIMEAVTTVFEEGDVSMGSEFQLDEEHFDMGHIFTEDELFDLNFDLSLLLDDDFGSQKFTDIVYQHLDAAIKDNFTIDLDRQEYV